MLLSIILKLGDYVITQKTGEKIKLDIKYALVTREET